ncbi:MAG: hypothetical protein IKT70_06270 [Clostridia bacterium]|nr:hypothetical protein [Clostridia bacterium]
MRKIISLVSALSLIVLLVGCSDIKPNTDETTLTPPETNETTFEQPSNSNPDETDSATVETDFESDPESGSKRDTITNIADWEALPWSKEPSPGWKNAPGAYNFIYNLVSGESTIPEYNELGIKDYTIMFIEDDPRGGAVLSFTFTVTGNSLPETLPPGTYTKIVYDGQDVYLYDGDIPKTVQESEEINRIKHGIDKFEDDTAAQAVHAYFSFMRPWEISPYGEWDTSDGILPADYICYFYGEYLEIGIDDMQRLLSEKFGITIEKPTEDGCYLNRCKYNKETNTVFYADTRGYESPHRIIDCNVIDGTSYVTVQFYADRLFLLPSHKITYKIGAGEVFLGYEIIEVGNYEPKGYI